MLLLNLNFFIVKLITMKYPLDSSIWVGLLILRKLHFLASASLFTPYCKKNSRFPKVNKANLNNEHNLVTGKQPGINWI